MAPETQDPTILRFGVFEVDLRSRELRKKGVRVKLQEQPFQVLTALLKRQGDLVTREELQAQIWPSETFVDFDNGLNTSINKLREALGDSADSPRFIETLPRRGYRFIGPVTGIDGTTRRTTTGVSKAAATRTRKIVITAAIALLAAGIAGGLFWRSRQAHRLTEKDTIVLADFKNTTGDPVFDDALKQGLRVQLEQSPFLNILSDHRVVEELRLMGRPPDEQLTPEVARDLCQRAGSKAVLEGSIATLGSRYVIDLNALACQTGDALASAQVEADSHERVLKALGDAATAVRKKLGESLASVEKYDVPLEHATTPSLGALKAYSIGLNQAILNDDSDSAASSLQRAVSLDPNFAVAYSALAAVYNDLGDVRFSIENARKGYELRDHASDREKFSIESYYDVFVLGNLEKGTAVAKQWVRLFPRDLSALHALHAAYYWSGQLDEALTTAREMLRLEPTALAYESVAGDYVRQGRLGEARATLQDAQAKHTDPASYADTLYIIAFLQNDQAAMTRLSAAPWQGPYMAPVMEFYTESYSGRVSRARELARRAIASATQRGEAGFIPSMEGAFALVEALEGNFAQAKNDLANAGDLSTNPNFDVVGEADMVAALSGDTVQAQRLADDLNRRFPEATVVQFNYLPAVRGLLAAHRGKAQEAVEALYPMASHERVIPLDWVAPYMVPVYLRGEAHLALHQVPEALNDFQTIFDNAGVIENCPIGALAHLGLGRAYVLEGDTAKAKTAYQDFLALWKDADPDVPILKQAKAEYANLH